MPLRYDRLYLYRGLHSCPSYCWLRRVQSVLFKATGQDKSLLSMSSCFNRKKRNRF